MNPDPRDFYLNRIPFQFNRSLAEAEGRAENDEPEAKRVLDDMRAVTTSIRVVVEGEGGGNFALDIDAGHMTSHSECTHTPVVTIRHDRNALAALAREAGDSALGFLGGLAGLAGEMRLTKSRLENLSHLQGSVRLALTGDRGFSIVTHFGPDPMPEEPQCTIRIAQDVYDELRAGQLPAQDAFMSGRIVIEGDMQMAMELALAALSPD